MGKNLQIDPENLIDFLEAIEDPRIDRTKKHELIDILIIAICAAVAGAKNWVEIEDFGNAKIEWFSYFLNFKHGIPSHDTFRRVFMLLDPNQFSAVFMDWVRAVTKDEDLKQICIDGKALRRSFTKGKSHSAIHMLNAWSTGISLSVGQMKIDNESNETTAVPKFLELLNVKGHIVTMDAINCQKNIAKKIVDKEGDYLLALKNNHKTLRRRAEEVVNNKTGEGSKSVIRDSFTTKEEGHGRFEKRTCNLITKKEDKVFEVNPLNQWPSLNSIAEVISERTNKKTGEFSVETRYYIGSLKCSAQEVLESVRGHWEVENKLHWVLDVVFREDDCRSRTGYSPENFSLLRHFALNLIKKEPGKKSIKRKQNLAGWDEEFLLSVLLGPERHLDA